MKRLIPILVILSLLAAGLPVSLAEAADDALIVVQDAEVEAAPADDALLLMDLADAEDGPSADVAEEAVLDLSGDGAEEGGEEQGEPSDDIASDEAPQMLFEEPQDEERGEGEADGQPSPEPVELEVTASVDFPMDSDELFAGYVNRILYSRRTRLLRTRATSSAGSQLTGQNRNLYEALKPHILKVAAGEESSTTFRIPVAEVLGGDTFTPQEYNELLANGWSGVNAWDTNLISQALWFDCTYELYWFKRYSDYSGDTYKDISFKYFAIPLTKGDDGNYHVNEGAVYTVQFAVLSRYAGEELYTVNTGLIARAKAAAENARAIVNKYAGYSDCGKLMGYAREICALVEYDHDAARMEMQDPTDQDPWKLINVFDGDSSTNVVCEGYSQAFQYLCELSSFSGGIRCILVTGIAGGDHSWNLVQMEDGQTYVMDVTWMDNDSDLNNLTGSMANWFNEGKGQLFLCGGDGSVSGGYTVRYRGGDNYSARTYREDTRTAYPDAMLAIAPGHYTLSGWQKLDGATYYFVDGRYVTGIQSINGAYYDFSDSGRLLSSQIRGWRAIGGDHYYFDDDGAMVTGWQTIDGIRYYFGGDGAMRTGWQTIDGARYFFEENGVLHEGHSAVVDAAVSPTCTGTGLTAGKHCSVCGEVLAAQEVVPALGHTEVADAAVAPTCTGTGLTAGKHCSVCNEVLVAQKVVPALGHTVVVDPAVAPTGTKTGLTAGSHCGTCGVVLVKQKVIPKLAPSAVTLNKSGTVTLVLDKKLKLKARVTPADAQTTLTWKSSRPKVATVNKNGVVTAVGKGKATITVRTANGKTAKVKVAVVPPAPSRIKLAQGKKATLKAGKKLKLTARLYPAKAESALTWTSDNPGVATVSGKGVVKARRKGKANITVSTANGRKAVIRITVVP